MNKTVLKKKLLTFTNGMTPLHYAIVHGEHQDFLRVLRLGREVDGLREMLTQKVDEGFVQSFALLDEKFTLNACAITYILEYNKLNYLSALLFSDRQLALDLLALYRAEDNGSMLHSIFVLNQIKASSHWIEFTLGKSVFDSIATIQDAQGKNFLMKHFDELCEHGFSFSDFLCSLNPATAISLLSQVDRNGDTLASFIFAKCPIEQSLMLSGDDKLSAKFKEALLQKNHKGQTAIHLFTRNIVGFGFADIKDKHDFLNREFESSYAHLLTVADSFGRVPIVDLFLEKKKCESPVDRSVVFLKNFIASLEHDANEAFKRIITARDSYGYTVLGFLDRFPDELFSYLNKLSKDELEDALFTENIITGQSLIYKLVHYHGLTENLLVRQLIARVDREKCNGFFSHVDEATRLNYFVSFPMLFKALFVDSGRSVDGGLGLSLSLDGQMQLLEAALASDKKECLSQIIANLTKQQVFILMNNFFTRQYFMTKHVVKRGYLALLLDCLGDDMLKSLLDDLKKDAINLLFMVSYAAPSEFTRVFELSFTDASDFSRVFESLGENDRLKAVRQASENLFLGAICSKNDGLVHYLLQKKFLPTYRNMCDAIVHENWSAYHLLATVLTGQDIISSNIVNIPVTVRRLLTGDRITENNRKLHLTLAQCIRTPSGMHVDNPNNYQRFLIHASCNYDSFRQCRKLSHVMTDESIRLFIERFDDGKFPWELDKNAKKALYHDLHITALGADNYVPTSISDEKVDRFLNDFLCRAATSKLHAFKQGEGAVIFGEYADARQRIRHPLLLSRTARRAAGNKVQPVANSPEDLGAVDGMVVPVTGRRLPHLTS